MADEYDVVERLEKQIEGSNLALAAVAEVLHKMDSRISKQEEYEMELAENEEDAIEKQEIIKAVAGEVYGLIKADQGLDLDGDKVRKAGSMAKGHDDAEKAVTPVKAMADQQATIQAMLKAAMEDDDEDEMEKADEGSAEEIVDEDEEKGGMDKEGDGEDEDMVDEEKSMEKQLDDLKNQIAGYEKNMAKAIQTEAENRLRKMGFREETSLQRPQIIQKDAEIGLGVDGSTPIKKSAESAGDTVEQLMDMSYQELRNLQYRLEAGDTDGLPKELIN